MKTIAFRPMVPALLAACVVSSVGCYPAYPPPNAYSNSSKGGYAEPAEAGPPPQYPPRYVVDPGLAIAGVAAAGLLGYAIGQNHGYHHHGHYYGGPRYYGRGYYRPRHYYH
jgi:hypothetical protein